eukprot:526777-Prymnesium_polylepis.1
MSLYSAACGTAVGRCCRVPGVRSCAARGCVSERGRHTHPTSPPRTYKYTCHTCCCCMPCRSPLSAARARAVTSTSHLIVDKRMIVGHCASAANRTAWPLKTRAARLDSATDRTRGVGLRFSD